MNSITEYIGKEVELWHFGSWVRFKFVSVDKHGFLFRGENKGDEKFIFYNHASDVKIRIADEKQKN